MSAENDLELITKIEPLLVEASLLEEGNPVDRMDVSDRISELLRGLRADPRSWDSWTKG
jgi:hypothetical protein